MAQEYDLLTGTWVGSESSILDDATDVTMPIADSWAPWPVRVSEEPIMRAELL